MQSLLETIMAIPKLRLDAKPSSVLEEHVHCFTTMTADPLAAAHAPVFDGLVAEWNQVAAERVKLVLALGKAKARAVYIDMQLNDIVDLLVHALGKITKSKADPLWSIFLKGQDPSVFKRPILSKQLAEMTLWPPALASSPHPELVAIGAALVPLLGPAAAVEDEIAQAEQALLEFDSVGGWAQHVAKSNAARDSVYGDLLEIPHKNPGSKLPSDYADRFFLHDTSRRGAGKPRSSEAIRGDIEALEARLTQLRKDLADAETREKAEVEAEAERDRKAKELAELKQKEKENKAQQKALEKDLKKK